MGDHIYQWLKEQLKLVETKEQCNHWIHKCRLYADEFLWRGDFAIAYGYKDLETLFWSSLQYLPYQKSDGTILDKAWGFVFGD